MNKVYIEDGRFHGLKIAEEIEQCLIGFYLVNKIIIPIKNTPEKIRR